MTAGFASVLILWKGCCFIF